MHRPFGPTLRAALDGALGRVLGVGRTTDFDDPDVVFLMPVHRDAEVAFRALARVRRHWPGSRLVVLSDGDASFPGEEAERRFGAEYALGENLYGIEHGGRMVERLVELFLAAPGRWLVRLDSDARVDRRFAWLPTADGLHGRIGRRSGTVQGGAIVLTRGAAETLAARGVLRSPALLDPATTWGRYSTGANLRRKLALGTVAYDKVLHWACREAGVAVRGFDEIHSLWHADPDDPDVVNADRRRAIVHPDKTMDGGPGADR